MQSAALLPGVIAAAGDARAQIADVVPGADVADIGALRVASWHLGPIALGGGARAFSLSRVVRRAGGALDQVALTDALRRDPGSLTDLLPPFAAVRVDEQGADLVADGMGFQPLYRARTDAGALAGSSALAVARAGGCALEESAVGIQSLLGWQLGQETLFRGVRKLPPGATGRMDADGVVVVPRAEAADDPIELDEAVSAAANLLRASVDALLDDHPDAVLQLTGGMDSRLLLSAIPPSRRRGLHAMTLDVPGKGDVAIARDLSGRYGLVHEVHGLADLAGIEPDDAWQRCVAESTRLDAMSDPVALAAQRVAERAFTQGVRISGLGGEVARGFYYVGRIADRTYTRADAARLAGWRMFANDAVEPGLLTDEFSAWAREMAVDAVFAGLQDGGAEWFRATDHLYLRHRMQRWAGATDVAVGAERMVINPMLDPAFLDIAMRLRPRDKVGARFLALLQERLDPELARVPLDGRPAPIAYAHPPAGQALRDIAGTLRRAARKGLQRATRGNRPPAGGEVIAAKVVEHWRRHPDLIGGVGGLRYVREEWLAGVLEGTLTPRPSSVAFVTNLVVARGDDEVLSA